MQMETLDGFKRTAQFLRDHGFPISTFGLSKITKREASFPKPVATRKHTNGTMINVYSKGEILEFAEDNMSRLAWKRGARKMPKYEEEQAPRQKYRNRLHWT